MKLNLHFRNIQQIWTKTHRTNVDQLVNEIVVEEPIISESKKPQLKNLIISIILLSLLDNDRAHCQNGIEEKSKIWTVSNPKGTRASFNSLCIQQKWR